MPFLSNPVMKYITIEYCVCGKAYQPVPKYPRAQISHFLLYNVRYARFVFKKVKSHFE